MSEFCQHSERSRRCVLRAHPPTYSHEMQPMSALSVRTIERQEALERRLSDPVQQVVTALEEATSAPVAGSAPVQGSTASTIETSSTGNQTSVGAVGVSASESSTS